MYHRARMLGLLFVLGCVTPVVLGIPLAEHDLEFSNDVEYVLEDLDHPYKNVPNPQQLVEQAGYSGETHQVTTEDGYILTMHRITRSPKNPNPSYKPAVLLIHGLLDCSATWVLTSTEKGLGYLLADRGYDVWMGNVRGNRYSRKHTYYNTADNDYWMFSWHEMGMHDLPAMIDKIQTTTRQKKILYVGHSQGSTAFFVMASERPEYQEKIEAMFALAPPAFMSRMKSPIVRLLAPYANSINKLTDLIGLYEFKPTGAFIQKVAKLVCDEDALTHPLCTNIVFLFGGKNDKDFNTTLISTIAQYDPAGASTRQFVHYAQLINSANFERFDYGLAGNLKKYGKIRPPKYPLDKIKIPVYLHYSSNDDFCDVNDVRKLYEALPNAQKLLVPYEWFTHLDFIWSNHMDTLLYNRVMGLMMRHVSRS